MADYELIKRVCDLTCSKEDVVRGQTTIKYDTEYPFEKYYNIETIVGAFNKYLSHEWDDKTLSHWVCIYCWIINGGFDENLKEKLNPLEEFLKEMITWDLDGLSFFEDDLLEEGIQEVYNWIELYENFDHVLKTSENWKAIYAMVGPYAESNEDQYVVLINDKEKEYIIIYSYFLENGSGDEYFKYVSEEDFITLIEQLKEKEYKILSCSEEFYYSVISEE